MHMKTCMPTRSTELCDRDATSQTLYNKNENKVSGKHCLGITANYLNCFTNGTKSDVWNFAVELSNVIIICNNKSSFLKSLLELLLYYIIIFASCHKTLCSSSHTFSANLDQEVTLQRDDIFEDVMA